MISGSLNYDDDDFAVRARKLIVNGHTFSFEIAGTALQQLMPLVAGGRIGDLPKLGLWPKLQPLMGVLLLADAQGRAVSLEVEPEHVRVVVGVGKA